MVRKFLLHRAVRFLSILCEGRPQTKGNGCSIMIRIGLDIGSTTLKCVVLNERGELLYKNYRRHFSRIAESAAAMLGEIATAFPEEKDCDPVISGSAGMGIADALGVGGALGERGLRQLRLGEAVGDAMGLAAQRRQLLA